MVGCQLSYKVLIQGLSEPHVGHSGRNASFCQQLLGGQAVECHGAVAEERHLSALLQHTTLAKLRIGGGGWILGKDLYTTPVSFLAEFIL